MNKYVDMMKKNRFTMCYSNFESGEALYIGFVDRLSATNYKGGIKLSILNIDSSGTNQNIGTSKYIGSFDMVSGDYQGGESFALVSQIGVTNGLSPTLGSWNNDLKININNNLANIDVRVDVEFLYPDDNFMIYTSASIGPGILP